ncbi:MAG: bifunctional metallophosphatase/5'-nucleotidase [Deltaproteobacteria bacterium]|nr:bifunctional metallophosphatase/5'-nucleotidase [Deltaproteobacteria bacterium]
MKKLKRFREWSGAVLIWVWFCILPGLAVGAGGTSWYDQVIGRLAPSLAIVTTADLQSRIYPAPLTGDDAVTIGGLDRVAALARRVESEVDGVLLVSTGDDLMGAFYSVFSGEPEIGAMNLAGYDVVVPGNHEFDLGIEVYAAAASRARFPILAANLEFAHPDLAALVKPGIIMEVGGLKLGFFGLVTPDLKRVCQLEDDEVEVDGDLVGVARRMVEWLRDRNAGLVVALSHCGSSRDRELASSVAGLDLIVGGHSHEILYETLTRPDGGECVIVQAGAGGDQAGVFRCRCAGRIIDPRWEIVRLDEKVGSMDSVREYVEGYVAEFDRRLGEPVGETRVALDSRKSVVRTRESNLGNLVADAVADWFRDEDGEPPLVLVSGGAIRGDRLYPAGPLSRKDVLSILPFGNTIIRAELSGKQIKALLEASASALGGGNCPLDGRVSSGGFLQLSRAFRVVIDPAEPSFCGRYDGRNLVEVIEPGRRVVQVEILRRKGWQPLVSTANYTVYINSWPASGGDGHYVFADADKVDTTVLMADALARYVARHSPVRPQVEGRIIIY